MSTYITFTRKPYRYEDWKKIFQTDEGTALLEDMRILVGSFLKHGLKVSEIVINPHGDRPINSACLDRLVEVGELELDGWVSGPNSIQYRSFKRRSHSSLT